MASKEDEILNRISRCLNECYLEVVSDRLIAETEQMTLMIEQVEAFYALPESSRASNSQITEFKSRWLAHIQTQWPQPQAIDFINTHEALLSGLNEIFEGIPKSKKKEQKSERFTIQKNDSIWTRMLKFIKRIGLGIGHIPLIITNLFRKNKKPKQYWTHEIPLRNLTKDHFLINTLNGLSEATQLIYRGLAAQYISIKRWEETLAQGNGVESIKPVAIDDFRNNLLDNIAQLLNEITQKNQQGFNHDIEKAGTMELPGRHLSDEIITKRYEQAEAAWTNYDLHWKNTIFAVFEEWRLDLNVHLLKHKTLSNLEDFQQAQFKKMHEYVRPELNGISSFIEEGLKAIEKPQETIQKELKRLNYQAVKKLDMELVPQLCEKLSHQSVINLINKLEVNIDQHIEVLSDERVIVKSDAFDSPIKTSDLNKISPRELITFEMLPGFKSKINTIKQSSFSSLQNTADHVKDLDHIITFSLSSAISTLENHPEKEEEATSIAVEGLKRAQTRLLEEQTILDESITSNSEQLESAINDFCGDIMELTFNENVRELRMRVAKAKAAQQALQVRRKLEEKILERKRNLTLVLLGAFNKIRHRWNVIAEDFILTAKKPEITKQVADFLLESQQAIDRLPQIYKRLYQIEPLDDLELFVGRQEEFLTLKKAFESWGKGHYAATIVVGEKWGGLTSFLNYAVANARFTHTVTRLAVVDNGCSGEHMIHILRKIFKNDEFTTLSDVIKYLNESPKRIVILEDIQNLFLRKVDGFEALEQLFKLINETNKNVFWISSTSIYAWAYLKKTIFINEYFSYEISLKSMTNEQIIDIIWKRNRISGFKIRFEAQPELAEDKKFSRLDEEAQQQLLKKKFFSELNVFAQSNISLALIYWLLSTKNVDDSSITIGKFKKPNLNFLTILSMDKLYTLHAIILHDGLTETQLAQVLCITPKASSLTLLALLEDGIIINTNGIHLINPLVYRNTVSLLHSRNLIH
ncbi:MAG: hypothetical protein ABJF11_04240 [Reichenbachiella sp.]|uniref:hypothetical protein n=1 Tax=Reichenbachiella sp. TaxID=2184521 RepID=UPI003263016C